MNQCKKKCYAIFDFQEKLGQDQKKKKQNNFKIARYDKKS